MRGKLLMLAGAVAVSLTLGGCDKIKALLGGGKPGGQVVATVNGEEITTRELNAEMNGFSSRDPNVMKAAQQQALQQIIMRDLLAQKGREEKLDKSPEYQLQVRRGEQSLLAQLYERKLATGAAAPSRQDAELFVAGHPTMFSGRKLLTVDQVIAASPAGKIKPEQLQPLKTLDEVKALLDANGIPYRESAAVIDTLSTDPNMVAKLDQLPPGEIFVLPQQGALSFNRIRDARPAPLHGDLAVNYAINVLRGQKAQEVVRTQLINIRAAGEKSINYSAAYKPDKPFDAKAALAATQRPEQAGAAPASPPPAAGTAAPAVAAPASK